MGLWNVWQPEDGESEARVVAAHDAEEAAEKWASAYDGEGDYTIVRGSEATVLVRALGVGDAPVQVFFVEGESVPRYSASLVEVTAPPGESWAKGESGALEEQLSACEHVERALRHRHAGVLSVAPLGGVTVRAQNYHEGDGKPASFVFSTRKAVDALLQLLRGGSNPWHALMEHGEQSAE